MDRTKLPTTWGKNALKFGGEADALPGYLDAVEDVITKTGASTEEEKIEIAIHFCDHKIKREWKALLAEEPDSSWHEFRARIRESYPEFKELERGSIAALEKFVKKTHRKPIRIDDITGLQSYIRQYRAMVGQLLKPTMRISNRDATKNFLIGLHPDFSLALRQQLRATAREGMTSYKKAKLEWEAEPANKGKPFVPRDVDNDDKYVWTDVIEIATVLCEEESGSYYELEPYPEDKKRAAVMMQGSEGEPKDLLKQLADKVGKLESSRAKDDTNLKEALTKDIMSSLEEVLTGHMDKFTADQHREMQKLQMAVESRSTPPSNPPPNHTYPNPVPNFARNRAAPARSDNCFYCYRGGHFIDQCDDRKADLEKGIIHLTNGRLTFFDGKIVPREPAHKSPREKAHDHYNRRAISQNYDEIMDTYFGSEEDIDSGGASTQLNQDDVRSMMATINRLEQSFVQTRAGGPAESASGFR
jgi:hypothetical protein